MWEKLTLVSVLPNSRISFTSENFEAVAIRALLAKTAPTSTDWTPKRRGGGSLKMEFVMREKHDDHIYIYRASIRLKNGRRIFAHQYGLQAFRIRIKKPPEARNTS